MRKPVEELLSIYTNALTDYITSRMTPGDNHIVDFAVEVSSFSECFYYTVQALTKE